LHRAHQSGNDATDDAALVEALGIAVRVVPGEPNAHKITTPADLEWAKRLAETNE
jgi:2-C-methyl-D-erythritol 4-phosphate cytidylyltransferase